MRNKKQHYIYPVYFDAKRSRSQGRRIRKKIAIEGPTVQEIAEAANILDLPYEINLEAAYPRFWWIPSGCVKVKKQDNFNKNALIKKLAIQLKKTRARK